MATKGNGGGGRGASAKAAAVRAEQQRKERRRVLVMGGVVVAVLVIIVGGAFFVATSGGSQVDGEDVPAAASSDYGLAVGEEDAPTQVVIYEDFLCPVCGAFEEQTNDDLTQAAADGEVLVEYRPFELLGRIGDYSKRATNAFAVVLEESGPEVAKAFHDELYADQPSESAEEFPDDDWLVEKAVAAGAEEAEVRPGIEDLAMEDWVDSATAEAEAAGVTGTPTVLVDGEPVGGQTIDEVARNTLDAIGG